MTAKKKFNFKAPLEVFAKSIVQPMMYLSVAGILLIGGGLALLSLLGWAASRRNPTATLAPRIV